MSIIKNSLLLIALMFVFSTTNAQKSSSSIMSHEVKEGMALFQGKKRFENKGPSCLSCHHVSNIRVALGGTFAKDLTDVYSRMGEGLTVWLSAPSYEAMVTSYRENKLTEEERKSLTAFFKYANEAKEAHSNPDFGIFTFLIGGLFGLFVLLGAFSLIWKERKTEMVKQEVFDRSIKALDAKF